MKITIGHAQLNTRHELFIHKIRVMAVNWFIVTDTQKKAQSSLLLFLEFAFSDRTWSHIKLEIILPK